MKQYEVSSALFYNGLQLLLIHHKLLGTLPDWSWFWVLWPTWALVGISFTALALVAISARAKHKKGG